MAHFLFYYLWYTRLFVEFEPTYHEQFINQILLNDPDESFLKTVDNTLPTKFTTFLSHFVSSPGRFLAQLKFNGDILKTLTAPKAIDFREIQLPNQKENTHPPSDQLIEKLPACNEKQMLEDEIYMVKNSLKTSRADKNVTSSADDESNEMCLANRPSQISTADRNVTSNHLQANNGVDMLMLEQLDCCQVRNNLNPSPFHIVEISNCSCDWDQVSPEIKQLYNISENKLEVCKKAQISATSVDHLDFVELMHRIHL